MAQVVRCHATREDGRACKAFVAQVPGPCTVGLVEHSRQADPESIVAPCISCGTLHEIRVKKVA